MTDPITFVLAALALLGAPGPTNALVATSGAVAGLKRSVHVILAATLGYLIVTAALALIIGPLVRTSRLLDLALRIACGLYLLYAAWRLWDEGAAVGNDAPVSFRRVLIATSLNPKGILFAFVIVPYLAGAQPMRAAPYMAALAGLTILVVTAWLAIGATFRAAASGRYARRIGAAVLLIFALLIIASAFSA